MKTQTNTKCMNDRRKGKIARLPDDVRAVVNRMLRDGTGYGEIVEQLKFLGHEGMKTRNVSRWYQGGYQDWLRDQGQLEQLRLEREFAAQMLKENTGASMHEAGLQLLTMQMLRLLGRFDLEALQEGLEATQENYTGLLRAFVQVSRRTTELERLKLATATQKRSGAAQEALDSGERGVSPETLARAAKELKLFKLGSE